MTDAVADPGDQEGSESKKSGKLPLIIGLVLAVLGGGGGFYAVSSGLLPLGKTMPVDAEQHHGESMESAEKALEISAPPSDVSNISFVPMEPIMISISDGGDLSQLRFRAQLEVPSEYEAEVTKLMPRIIDVLNGYLRALEPQDLRSPMALTKLRSQMLRRINIVTGQDRVSDLLVMEFVLN